MEMLGNTVLEVIVRSQDVRLWAEIYGDRGSCRCSGHLSWAGYWTPGSFSCCDAVLQNGYQVMKSFQPQGKDTFFS